MKTLPAKIIFPIPIDLFAPFIKTAAKIKAASAGALESPKEKADTQNIDESEDKSDVEEKSAEN